MGESKILHLELRFPPHDGKAFPPPSLSKAKCRSEKTGYRIMAAAIPNQPKTQNNTTAATKNKYTIPLALQVQGPPLNANILKLLTKRRAKSNESNNIK